MRLPTSSYIGIKKGRLKWHIQIKGGNHRIRFSSQNYYKKGNAQDAAIIFSKETGLKYRGEL